MSDELGLEYAQLRAQQLTISPFVNYLQKPNLPKQNTCSRYYIDNELNTGLLTCLI